ncbi:ABC transporter ATP-binding protein [Acrocarpospora macrocephala]|uniref:ABC transporter ATP-binding protein n=1 Tax=Acrocarpospora macrocephala TaxID=150177 RepID=A0A5M3WG17_9ACTN|nr:ATP-binding cassette domain-containing protein [Acrocarpospora macrocephala]GES08037.1 ABC transporter ATP-binding protein [Acrocarpospora macrocephala]
MTGTAPLLSMRQLSWSVGGMSIVDDVSLDVAAGEFVGVIGPNGAGKTSLFNLLTGLYKPVAGRIMLAGRDITGLAPHRRARLGLGRSFQASAIFASMTVHANVQLALQAAAGGLRSLRRTSDDRILHVLSDVGLSMLATRPAGLLSHGDKRKLEIAMLLAAAPAVLLLDEPLAGVATADIDSLTEVIADLAAGDSGRAVLMVEHDLDVLLGLSTRVAVMHQGALLAYGSTAEVMADPAVQRAYLGAAT